MRFKVGYAFDLKHGMLEIEQEADFKTGDIQIAKHLGDMSVIERFNHLEIHQYAIIDNYIWDEIADVMGFVGDRKDLLRTEFNGTIRKFDTEGTLV